MELMFRPIMHYADFSGRSRRTEYWLFTLFKLIVYGILWTALIVCIVNMPPTSGADSASSALEAGNIDGLSIGVVVSLILLVLAWMFFFLPSLAVQVRRYHDQGLSGLVGLLNIAYYIPYLGFLVGLAIMVIMLLPGNSGPNQYGPDPKDPLGTQAHDRGLRNVFD